MLYQLTITKADHEPLTFVLSPEQLAERLPWITPLIVDVFYLDYTVDLVRYKVKPAEE
jgi:hypothetical protein